MNGHFITCFIDSTRMSAQIVAMKTHHYIIAAVLSLNGLLAFHGPAFAGPECTCRHEGGDVAEGQTACIKSPNGMKMARCEKVLNNTSWKILDTPCPYSQVKPLEIPNMTIAELDFRKSRQISDF